MKANGSMAKDKVILLNSILFFLFIKLGFGVFFYANGSRYEGNWENNLKQGLALF